MLLQTKNKKVLEKCIELWDEIKDQVETVRDFLKIRFESVDDLTLGKILSIPACIIVVGYVFQEGNNYYPQVYLHECLYEYEYEYEY